MKTLAVRNFISIISIFFVVLCQSISLVPSPYSCVFEFKFICLTNRFHVAVRLFSNRSQMTSKCGKNENVAHEAIAECVTDVLATF